MLRELFIDLVLRHAAGNWLWQYGLNLKKIVTIIMKKYWGIKMEIKLINGLK